MRHMQRKTEKMKPGEIVSNKIKLISFISGLIFILLLDYGSVYFKIATINQRHFFGLLGNNYSAILVSFLLLIFLCFYVLKNKKYLIPCGFIFVGGASNLIDRLIYGGVPDYIQISYVPKFNLADSIIILGVLWLLYELNFGYKKTP